MKVESFYINVISLYGAKIAAVLFPVVIIPLISQFLSNLDFGIVMYSIAYATWLSILTNYGFILYGSRALAEATTFSQKRRIVSDVIFAKLILCIPSILITWCAFLLLPIFENNLLVIFIATFYALVLGFNPIWFYQGIQNLKLLSITEIFISLVSVIILAIEVDENSTVAEVLFYISIPKFLGYVFLYVKVISYIKGINFNLSSIKSLLVNAKQIFIYRVASSFYTTGNVILLGVVVSPSVVAMYATAERVISAAIGLTSPLTQSLYPKINVLKTQNPVLAKKYSLIALLGMTILAIAAAISIYSNSHLILEFLLPAVSQQAIELLNYMTYLIPIMTINIVLGIQFLLPNKKDREFNLITIFAGIINLFLAIILIRFFEAKGLVMSVFIAEALVSLLFICIIKKMKFSYV